MRAAPNYTPGEAVDGKWKEELLKYLAEIFNLKVFVESGTCEASTLVAVCDYFEECYSIELSDHYYQIAKKRIRKNKPNSNIRLFYGNSASEMPKILATFEPETRALFWLDAHPSGGLTANEGDPLPEEIRAIIDLSPNSLIVIDDLQNGELGHVKEAGVDLSDWTIEFRTGIVFLYKKGLYEIPEFE